MGRRRQRRLIVRYKNDPQIVAMTGLVSAYQARDVQAAEKILKGGLILGIRSSPAANRDTITGDPFIQYFIDDLLRSLRTQYIIDIIKPYTRLELDYIGKVRTSALEALAVVDVRLLTSRPKKLRAWSCP